MSQEHRGSPLSREQGTEEIIPPEGYLELPEPSYLHIQHLEKAISDLKQRIFFLEDVIATFGSPIGAFGPAPAPADPFTSPGHWPFPGHGVPGPGFPGAGGPGGRPPAPLGIWWGPILHAPASQTLRVCVWSSVTVILVKRGVFGGITPMVGATVTFSITAGTGIAISSTAGGPGVRPGASVNVTTNALGEVVIHVHGATAGTATLNSDGPGLSKNTTLTIV